MKQLPGMFPMMTIAALVCVFAAGCAPTRRTEETTTVVSTIYTTPPRDTSEALQRYAIQLQTARDSATEAAVLRELHQYKADNDLMYQTKATRLDTNTPVSSPSAHPYPLRMDVTIYRRDVLLYTISFVPRDNRNLSLLGE